MNILVIGSGGREHALVWKLKQSDHVETVYCAPGNGGMIGEKIQNIQIQDYNKLADFCLSHGVGLVVVGPEKPLCAGIVDLFRERGLSIFGPDKKSAQLESSKWFAKKFMDKYNLPTAEAVLIHNLHDATAYIMSSDVPIVVKADGLAAGKGVTVACTKQDALDAVERCFSGKFGQAGNSVLLEKYLEGEEVSIHAFLDHHTIKILAASQDHKRLLDGDKGPNTGGMGAYSPFPMNDALSNKITSEILQPFLIGCQKEKFDYRGLIYIGIILTEIGPKILEFNVRFGDPETQAILVRLQSDLSTAMLQTIDNQLSEYEFIWSKNPAACVVAVSGGYPGNYQIGYQIRGIREAESLGGIVFHAGTEQKDTGIVTSGGRVLGITASNKTFEQTFSDIYNSIDRIHWRDMYFRRDIGKKMLYF